MLVDPGPYHPQGPGFANVASEEVGVGSSENGLTAGGGVVVESTLVPPIEPIKLTETNPFIFLHGLDPWWH